MLGTRRINEHTRRYSNIQHPKIKNQKCKISSFLKMAMQTPGSFIRSCCFYTHVTPCSSQRLKVHLSVQALPVDHGPGLEHAELAGEIAMLLLQIGNGGHARDGLIDGRRGRAGGCVVGPGGSDRGRGRAPERGSRDGEALDDGSEVRRHVVGGIYWGNRFLENGFLERIPKKMDPSNYRVEIKYGKSSLVWRRLFGNVRLDENEGLACGNRKGRDNGVII